MLPKPKFCAMDRFANKSSTGALMWKKARFEGVWLYCDSKEISYQVITRTELMVIYASGLRAEGSLNS